MKRRMKVSKGGQISIPSEIRRRWGGDSVTVLDEGNRLIITPATVDAVDLAAGSLRRWFADANLVEIRECERRAEEATADRRA